MGLLGITIGDNEFFELAEQGVDIAVNVASSKVSCGGKDFAYQLSDMEKQLIAAGGITEAFKKYGKKLFDVMCDGKKATKRPVRGADLKDIENL